MDTQPVEGQATLPISEVWLSLSQIAQLKKVSIEAISKRVKRFVADNLIEVKQDGREKKVNLVVYDRLIGANTDPAQALRNPGGIAQPTTTVASDPAPPTPDDPAKPQYSASRALRESYDAENSRLDLEERLKRLGDMGEVEARTFRVFRRARDRFLSLSAVCAPRVFNASDERAARQIMDEEVRKLLAGLADDLDRGDLDDAAADLADEDVSDAVTAAGEPAPAEG
jgi:hypothetical protein